MSTTKATVVGNYQTQNGNFTRIAVHGVPKRGPMMKFFDIPANGFKIGEVVEVSINHLPEPEEPQQPECLAIPTPEVGEGC